MPDPATPAPAKSCFVIMPFGGWFDRYYVEIYFKAIEEAGLVPRRADDLYRPSTIVRDIWEMTREATIILADLTDRNPNVLYELGLAHAITKPVVMVAATIEDVPFDLRGLRILTFDKNEPAWDSKLREKVVRGLKETLAAPLKSIPAAFIQSPEPALEVTPRDRELLEIRQELDLIKREIQVMPSHGVSVADDSIGRIQQITERVRNLVRAGVSISEIPSHFGGWEVPYVTAHLKALGAL